jgi:hypothetical protein
VPIDAPRFLTPPTLLRILHLFAGRGDQLPCHRRGCNSASRPSRLPLVSERRLGWLQRSAAAPNVNALNG